jgi:hypothetical protein
MIETGNLAQVCFPLLLARYHRDGSTGTLEVHEGLFRKRVYLREGRVIFAASNNRNDRLGEMLIRRGALKVPDYLAASGEVVPGKRFGTLLVERGTMSAEQLVWAVKEQVKEIVFTLFDVRAASYMFREGEEAEEEVITLNLNTPELIRQGVARMDSVTWALDAFRMPALRLELSVPREKVDEAFELGEFEQELLAALAAPKPIAELFADSPFPQFDLLKFIWVLCVLEMVRVLPPEEGSPPSEPSPEIEVTGEDLGQTS